MKIFFIHAWMFACDVCSELLVVVVKFAKHGVSKSVVSGRKDRR